MANWVDDVVNIGINGSTFKLKAVGDAGYYSVPGFRSGTLRVTPVGTKDGKQRSQYHHFRVTATVICMFTDVTNMIEVLPVFMTGTAGKRIFVKVDGLNGQTKFYSE